MTVSLRKAEFTIDGLPPLPKQAYSRDGAKFHPRSDRWTVATVLRGPSHFDFGVFEGLSAGFRHKLKHALLWYLQHRSFSHALNIYGRFKAFYVAQMTGRSSESIELSSVVNYNATLGPSGEWKLGVLRILVEDSQARGMGIASEDVLNFFAAATIRGNVKGTAIRTRDPEDGAFTDVELLSMQSSLNDAYGRGRIDLYAYAVAWLFLAYGVRSIQIALLKESDLIVSKTEEGSFYTLRIPRSKQRHKALRAEMRTRYCGKPLGLLLEKVIEHNRRLRDEKGLEGTDWPLFMARVPGRLPGFTYHQTSQDIRATARNVIGRITGVKTNPKRFRTTLAQRAADDGKDIFTVADLLDHSDIQNVKVYYEAGPSLVLRLDRHLAMELAPIAQAFAGVVVSEGASPVHLQIYDRSLKDNTKRLGDCGQMSFCGLAIPFACYTCRHFKPWLDGPHEEFLAALIGDRDRMRDDGLSSKIYTIKDRTILAVAEVIQLCAASLEEREAFK